MSEVEEISDGILAQYQNSTVNVLTSVDVNPDDAGRALQLSKATGVNPSHIWQDLPRFEREAKVAATTDLLRGNPIIQDYINGNAMASRVSNDDYDNLDSLSGFIKSFGEVGPLASALKSFKGLVAADLAFTERFMKGLEQGWGPTPPMKWAEHGVDMSDPRQATALALAKASPLGWIGAGSEAAIRSLSAVIKAAQEGAYGGVEALAIQAGADPMMASRMGREAASMVQWISDQPLHFKTPMSKEVVKTAREASVALREVQAWVDTGAEPPVGVNPIIDMLKIEQSKIELDNLSEMEKVAAKSKTRERSPELFADYVRRHTDAKISVNAEAVAKLYGEKLPELEDGILGWVPQIQEQIKIAIATGDDIQIPLADWLAHVDPEVAKALKDDIRVRKGGVTTNEAKVLGEVREAFEVPPVEGLDRNGQAVQSVRRAMGVDKEMGLEKKLTLQRSDEPYPILTDKKAHSFVLTQDGKPAIELYIAEDGKRIHIDDMRGLEDFGPNDFGPAAIRDVIRQLAREFPQAEELSGLPVAGARGKAGELRNEPVVIKLRNPDLGKAAEILEGVWQDIDENYRALVPTKALEGREKALVELVNDTIRRIVGDSVNIEVARTIEGPGKQKPVGLHIGQEGIKPIIMIALDATDPLSIARHEAMHQLKRSGLIDKPEWATLMAAAIENGWIEKHQINKNYRDSSSSVKIEEAIAYEFGEWRKAPEAETAIGKIFQKIEDFLQQIKVGLKEMFGRDLTWEELFQKADRGDFQKRAEGKVEPGVAEAKQPELPGTRRMEDTPAFVGTAKIGLTAKQYDRYIKLIEQQQKDDLSAATERAFKEQKRRISAEWKENEVLMRKQAVEDVNARPEIAADNYLRDGNMYGDQVEKQKLDIDLLTPEQILALPKDYVGKDGVNPGDLAQLFGYPDGNTMVQGLIDLQAQRKQSGLNGENFRRRLIEVETQRLMEEKFGPKLEQILDEAKDQALADVQLELLHQETLLLGLKNDREFSYTMDQLREDLRKHFDERPFDGVTSDQYIAAAGRAGRMVEDALLKQDYAVAFQAKQQQYFATVSAKLAKEVEDLQAQFERTVKRYKRSEVKGIDQQITDYIQDLLSDAGVIRPFRNESASQRHGYTSFDAFVEAKVGEGWEIDVADYLRAGEVKQIEKMSVGEFKDLKEAIDSMAYIGREMNRIIVAGDKVDFDLFKAKVRANIQSLPARKAAVNWLYGGDALLVRMEEVMKDLDLRQEHGPLFGAVIRPMAEAKHTEYSMLEDLSKKLKGIRGDFGRKWRKSLSDPIPNDFFFDHFEGKLFDISREHMLNIMLNFGNRSSIDKFTKGHFGKDFAEGEAQLRQMFDRNATKQDWEYVQAIWDLWKDWQPESQKLYTDLGGGRKRWIDAEEIVTPHGNFAGGYFPVVRDPYRARPVGDPSTGSLFGPNYQRMTPANHYTKERTGARVVIEFQNTLERTGQLMQQQIHDIAFRRQVIDVKKILGDADIRQDIKKHYGLEYEEQLMPWLTDIANHYNIQEKSIAWYNNWARQARMNLLGSALGLNLRVILSPDYGALNPAAIARYNNYPGAEAMVMEKSKELPHTFRNMDRDFREQLERTISKHGWKGIQADATRYTFLPLVSVSQQFRKVTFFDEYMKGLEKGMSDGDAAAWADSAVRERHGSGGVPDMPAIMRSPNEFMKISTLFFGYFNTMSNWARQMPGQVKRGDYSGLMQAFYGTMIIGMINNALLFTKSKEDESWFWFLSKAAVGVPLGFYPIVREASNYFIEGHAPRSPYSSALQYAGQVATDIKRLSEGKSVKKPIQHAANFLGTPPIPLMPGVPGMAQIGRSAQFGYDVYTGAQRPRNILEWTRGIISGEARLKK